ncbi:MAG: hypothetical protein WDO56_21230 [Gammaproteobacteria bacterium]
MKHQIAVDEIGTALPELLNSICEVGRLQPIVGIDDGDVLSVCRRDSLVERIADAIIRLADPDIDHIASCTQSIASAVLGASVNHEIFDGRMRLRSDTVDRSINGLFGIEGDRHD